jgi:5'-nucleotidase / UDP-sugar diphosphatase
MENIMNTLTAPLKFGCKWPGTHWIIVLVFLTQPLVADPRSGELGLLSSSVETQTVTLLFTNDFESAYDPIDAYWRDDIQRIGGIPQIATLIDQIRTTEPNVFLFDSGDIFTGTLSKLTHGELPFELMISMNYDAMAIGNHEFEYGWEEFSKQKNRAPFPVLGANLFYKGTDHPYAQPYAIIERDGIRIGVIGILGQDAATALIPYNIAGLEVRDPIPIVRHYVEALEPTVDIIVLLTHQGKTAPMQTDDEAHPEIQRDIDADIMLAGAVEGIDVLFGGHADAGTLKPVIHPQTGTLIMQTYGQGYHLGYLQLKIDGEQGNIEAYDGRLIAVDSDELLPHPIVQAKLDQYRTQYHEIYREVGSTTERFNRRYQLESDLGNLFADIVREATQADIGLIPSGALRKDLPAGKIKVVDLMDAFPFTDQIATVEVGGELLIRILEQGLSLERGILQVSGLRLTYDPERPIGQRITSLFVGDKPLHKDAIYTIGTVQILAQGGDKFVQFNEGQNVQLHEDQFSKILLEYFTAHNVISLPHRGRSNPSNRR